MQNMYGAVASGHTVNRTAGCGQNRTAVQSIRTQHTVSLEFPTMKICLLNIIWPQDKRRLKMINGILVIVYMLIGIIPI